MFFNVFDYTIYQIPAPDNVDYRQVIQTYLKESDMDSLFEIIVEFANQHVNQESITVHDHGISYSLIHYSGFNPGIHKPTFLKKSKDISEYHVLDIKQNDIIIIPPGVLHGVAPSGTSVPRVTRTTLFNLVPK